MAVATASALALLTVQFSFYPIVTAMAIKSSYLFLASVIPLWAVKFSAYLTVQTAILGVGTKALGRFTNKDLMHKWYRDQ